MTLLASYLSRFFWLYLVPNFNQKAQTWLTSTRISSCTYMTFVIGELILSLFNHIQVSNANCIKNKHVCLTCMCERAHGHGHPILFSWIFSYGISSDIDWFICCRTSWLVFLGLGCRDTVSVGKFNKSFCICTLYTYVHTRIY